MRDIRFRGKREDNGEWVYGLLTYDKSDGAWFVDASFNDGYMVIPETVGQYTGLKDEKGKEIYEGDILTLSYGIPVKVDTLIIEYADDEVVQDISVSGWWMRNVRPNGVSGSLCKTYANDIEVIGNKWDNGDLLNDS